MAEVPLVGRLTGQSDERVQSTELGLFLLDNIIWPILVVVVVAFALLVNDFLTLGNVRIILYGSAALSALVLGESLCLLSGHFDLSVGATAGIAAIFTGVFLVEWFPSAPGVVGIALVLTVGILVGLFNGVSVAYFDINPFLQTLAVNIILSGGVIVLTQASLSDMPASYFYLGGGTIHGVPVALLLMAGVYALAGLWLKYSWTGRAIYAVGGDKAAAEEAGIDTSRIVVLVYVLSGGLAAVGGLLYTGYLGVAAPTIGQNDLFPAFAAAIIGGIDLFGGRGKILGAAGGVILLGVVESGLVLMDVEPTTVQMINGIILLFAIYLYNTQQRFRQRLLAE
jgi:ribose/xylose/arabinose/galactoside ABC-type transport system permease subunit